MNEPLAFAVMLGCVIWEDDITRVKMVKNVKDVSVCRNFAYRVLISTHHWQFIDDLVGDAASRRRERFHFSSRKRSTGDAVSRSMTTVGKAYYRTFMKFMFHLSRDQVHGTCCNGEALALLP